MPQAYPAFRRPAIQPLLDSTVRFARYLQKFSLYHGPKHARAGCYMPREQAVADNQVIRTNIPARMDRLPWSSWHWRVAIALGITWLLDGLEVTLAGTLGGILRDKRALGLSDSEVGLSATAYLLSAVIGALVFGYATDRLGRKNCSPGHYCSTWSPPPLPRSHGTFSAMRSSALSQAQESEVSTQPSTPPSTNSFRPASEARSTS
jgi:hypothetical protein